MRAPRRNYSALIQSTRTIESTLYGYSPHFVTNGSLCIGVFVCRWLCVCVCVLREIEERKGELREKAAMFCLCTPYVQGLKGRKGCEQLGNFSYIPLSLVGFGGWACWIQGVCRVHAPYLPAIQLYLPSSRKKLIFYHLLTWTLKNGLTYFSRIQE